ncbi:MAG: hypothetical protein OEY10_04110 [Nitrosopumilus sp.]|nr:hypothetical protein [Nitrosopumilus sp.]
METKFLTKDWTVGQLNALVKIIGEKNAKKVLNGTAKFQIISERFLESLGIIDIAPVKMKRDDYLKEGHNGTTKLYLSDNFKNMFLNHVSETIDYAGGKLEKLKLTKDRSDFQINEERGGILIQTIDDIAGQIIALTSKQPKGENGDLINNGYANIFYFLDDENRLFFVHVAWYAVFDAWFGRADVADAGTWVEGYVVLSPATPDPGDVEA